MHKNLKTWYPLVTKNNFIVIYNVTFAIKLLFVTKGTTMFSNLPFIIHQVALNSESTQS